jgi:hypothetical protein
LAAVVLEVLAGVRAPSEAAGLLGISLARYYQVEARALAGLVAACEPRRRGRGAAPTGNDPAALRRECERLRRECARQQALVRAAQRAVGLAPSPAPTGPTPTGAGRRRGRRPTARALKAAALLREDPAPPVDAPPAEVAAVLSAPANEP